MDQFKKHFFAEVEKHRPDLWRRCYPRIYEEPGCGQYYSAKEVGYQLLSTALRIEYEGIAGQSQMAEIIWASRLANLKVPTYWIGHDMAQAIQQTVPPVWFDWVNTPLPFEGMVFMVPRGILRHEDESEGEALFVSFVRAKNGDDIPTLSPGGPRMFNVLSHAFHVFASTKDGQALMHWTYTPEEDGQGKVNLAELDNLVQTFIGAEHSTYSMYSGSLTLNDNKFMARVCHFVFGSLLMLLKKPEFTTTAQLRNRVPAKVKGQPPKEFWSPNVLGLHYKIRKMYVPQGGTHASPEGHWVRGAWKMQPYGEKHSLRKEKWIEPYWRGGQNE